MVGVAGAVMLWVAVPPSDHFLNAYSRLEPLMNCGVGALIEFAEPTMTVRVNGDPAGRSC